MKKRVIAIALALCGCTGKYIRPVQPDLKIEATPERVARGEYLVNSVMACGTCHSGRDSGNDLASFLASGESTRKFLGGGVYIEMPAMGAHIWLSNITPDPETGLGKWTDDEIMRAIRDGVNRDNKLMFPMMPFGQYQYMSDDDLHAVVAYLRSVPKVTATEPRKETGVDGFGGFMLGLGVAHHAPVTAPVSNPDKSDKVKYGEYLARMGHCPDCHSGTDKGPRDPDDPLWMAGGHVDDLPGIGKVAFSNLTPDVETGLGKYSAEQIKQAMRTGTRLDGKKMAPPMSMFIPHWSTMTDEDLDALVVYLKSLKPAKNAVPERELTPEWKAKLEG